MNKCVHCEKETLNPKFCSRSCSAKHNNPKRKKKDYGKCKKCGNTLNSKHRSYCSIECANQHKRGIEAETKINNWLSQKWSGSRKETKQLSKTIRTYLLNKAEWRCEKCGWGIPNPMLGKPILTVSHIDGNPSNHAPDNLEVLCYNCHTLTDSFGSLNNGKGRGSVGVAR